MSSTNRNSFTPSFSNWMSFIPFSYLIALAKLSAILNKGGKSRQSCLVFDIEEMHSVFNCGTLY